MKRLSMVILTVALACNVAYAQCGMKNVIIMVADGWGYNQVLAAECFNGARQVYEEFPIRLAMSTYSYDGWGYDSAQAWADFLYVMLGWTDSASSATAMSTGVKIHDGQINVDPVTEAALFTTLQQAEELGKVTGVVTSVPLSHATPAGWTAHDTYRGNYSAIAVEMIDSSNCEVVMGCGHPLYNNDCTLDGNVTESDYDYVGGSAKWAQLVAGMAGQASGHPYPWTLIDNKLDFVDLATDPNPPPRVIGVPRARTTLQQARPTVIGEGGNGTALPYSAARNNCVPTLAEMSRAALNVLRHADDMNNGIFLMIEGGAVDWANHANQMGRMIEEMNDFNAAVGAVIAWIESNSDWQETLLIVTGDHETGYLWGPGSGSPATWNPLIDNGPGALPGFRYYSNTHTNSLIPLFAKGVGSPWLIEFATGSDPVRGAYLDNTDIARVVFGYYDCTLNVELLSFSAEFMGESIELLWTTASEQDNDRFLLSRNGVVIASVPSRGNSATLQHYEWTDTNVLSATEYRYTLTAVDMDGAQFELSASTVSTTPGGSGIAHDYELGQNYPNPFNAVTSIPFTLAEGGRVTLRIYSTTGRLVATAADQTFGPGRQHVSFDARDLASGVYIYSVESNGFTARRKMVLLR